MRTCFSMAVPKCPWSAWGCGRCPRTRSEHRNLAILLRVPCRHAADDRGASVQCADMVFNAISSGYRELCGMGGMLIDYAVRVTCASRMHEHSCLCVPGARVSGVCVRFGQTKIGDGACRVHVAVQGFLTVRAITATRSRLAMVSRRLHSLLTKAFLLAFALPPLSMRHMRVVGTAARHHDIAGVRACGHAGMRAGGRAGVSACTHVGPRCRGGEARGTVGNV